jgi:hypothetical protein
MRRFLFLGLVPLAIVGLIGAYCSEASVGTSRDHVEAAEQTPPSLADATPPEDPQTSSALEWSVLSVTAAGTIILLIRPRRRHVSKPSARDDAPTPAAGRAEEGGRVPSIPGEAPPPRLR